MQDEPNTRGEKREAKRRKRRKMGISGKGVRTLQEITRKRAEKILKEEEEQE